MKHCLACWNKYKKVTMLKDGLCPEHGNFPGQMFPGRKWWYFGHAVMLIWSSYKLFPPPVPDPNKPPRDDWWW